MRRIKDCRGMTLIETVVALAVVMLAAALIMMAVSSAQNLSRRGMATEADILAAMSQVEEGTGQVQPNARVRFIVGAKDELYIVNGEYRIGSSGEIILEAFEPEDGESDG